LILVDRDEEALNALTGSLGEKHMRFVGDVTDERFWEGVELPDLTHALVNAGIGAGGPIESLDFAEWRRVLSINLDGVFNCTKVLIDQMTKQSFGRVVNITSVIGQIGNFGQANYAASKAGVAAFSRSLAKELAAKGVTVNCVAPGFTETEMVQSIPEKVRARLLDQIPMKRFGRAEEVARACVFLCSQDGDYITGAELSINGGLFMQ